MSECRAGAPVRNDSGQVLWTFECNLQQEAHRVHEARDADGTILAWWPEGMEFFVTDIRLEHREPPASVPAPAGCATCRHWTRGEGYLRRHAELKQRWGGCHGIPDADEVDPSVGLAFADDTEGLGGGYVITSESFACALHEPAEG